MERNLKYRRESSPQTKRREKRLNKHQKAPHEQGSPTSSDQDAFGKTPQDKNNQYAKVSATGTHPAPQELAAHPHLHLPTYANSHVGTAHVGYQELQQHKNESLKTSKTQLAPHAQQQQQQLLKPQKQIAQEGKDSPESAKKNSSGSDKSSHRNLTKQQQSSVQTQKQLTSKTKDKTLSSQMLENCQQCQKKEVPSQARKQHKDKVEQNQPKVERKLLDDRYLLIKTIGHGRYAKVKLAQDLKTKRQVAIKILKVKAGRASEFSKHQSLDCLFSEISILADCDHKNIVKIKAASFDGVIVKLLCPASQSEESLLRRNNTDSSSNGSEAVTRQINNVIPINDSSLLAEEDRLEAGRRYSYGSEEDVQAEVIKRRGPICYYVMNFAKYGELYRLVEINERLSEPLVRYLFKQLMDGLQYLHQKIGVVHRDIKPENLLIDKHFRLVIADFNFATRLSPSPNQGAGSLLQDLPSESQTFESTVQRDISVGSVAYNAPELWEIENRLSERRQRGQPDLTSAECLNYDGIKADIFSAAATLFLLKMKYQPFRRAHPNDPYYKKLAFKGKKYFWKIYSQVQTSTIFKDIFEQMISHNPEDRPESNTVLEHAFADDSHMYPEEVQSEILAAFKNLEEVLGNNMDPFTDEIPGTHRVDDEFDPEREEFVRHDDEEFDKLRTNLIPEVDHLNKILRKKRFKKHVAKNEQYYFGQQEKANSNNQEDVSQELHQIKQSHLKDKYSIVDSSEANIDKNEKETAAAAGDNLEFSYQKKQQESKQFLTVPSQFKQMLADHLAQMVHQPGPPGLLQQPVSNPQTYANQAQSAAFCPTQQQAAAGSKQAPAQAQIHHHYHSDENKSQRSDDSGTLAHASRRARRTSSYSRFHSFHDDDQEE